MIQFGVGVLAGLLLGCVGSAARITRIRRENACLRGQIKEMAEVVPVSVPFIGPLYVRVREGECCWKDSPAKGVDVEYQDDGQVVGVTVYPAGEE